MKVFWMHMSKTYDLALLLTGENPQKRCRSECALELYKKGKCGGIFVTGGRGGFARTITANTEADETAHYLCSHGMPEEKVFRDGRSLETLGNFTFPWTSPMPCNPSLNGLTTILVTEEKHMTRALECFSAAIGKEIDYVAPIGDYKSGIVTKLYHSALLRGMKNAKVSSPEEAHQFLLNQHPFYQKDWFEKPIWKRRIRLITKCLKWL